MGKIASHIQAFARRLGVHLSRYPPRGSLERELRDLLQRLNINCVFDVGAHTGETVALLRQLGYEGDIVSFEPESENFARLTQACKSDERWRGYPLALGQKRATMPLHVFALSDLNSLLQPNAHFAERLRPHLDVLRTVPVEIVPLAEILDECIATLDAPSLFLKLDTQGYDWQVIEGLGERLDDFKGLFVELPVQEIYEGMVGFTDFIDYLKERGFELTAICTLSQDADGCLVEVNGLARRR